MTTPGRIATSQSHDAIARRAADFCQRRHFWEWNEADQAELDAWLAESLLHRAAWLRLEGTVVRTEKLATLRLQLSSPARAERAGRGPRGCNYDDVRDDLTHWVPFPRSPRSSRGSLAGDDSLWVRFAGWAIAIAASIALIAAVAIPLANYLAQSPDRAFSTDVGGRTLLKFADGTEIELNTDTAMRFRMTRSERTVWLEKGEAWFHVTHDAANPFTVVIGRHRVTDLGTEFFVRRGAGDMEVALVAGRAMLNTDGTPAAMLTPGDDAVATPASVSVTRRTPQQLADALAWRRGVLVFRSTKLSDVVREFNRYNETRLVIADPAVANMTLGGEFKTDNLDHFLSLAQEVLKLRVQQQGNDILLTRANATARKGAGAP